MREIKFRVWHKKKLHPLMAQRILTIDFAVGGAGAILVEVHPNRVEKWEWEDVELMQYTGIRDRNGKEIYEGDIVRTENEQEGEYPYEESYKGVVTYQGDSFHIVQSHDTYTPTLKNITIQRIEVIGNIYENPELIKMREG